MKKDYLKALNEFSQTYKMNPRNTVTLFGIGGISIILRTQLFVLFYFLENKIIKCINVKRILPKTLFGRTLISLKTIEIIKYFGGSGDCRTSSISAIAPRESVFNLTAD